MSRRDPKARLLHMRDYAQKAVAMVEGQTRASLDSDEKLRLALTHLVELVGEAAGHVPAEIQAQYPEVPWPKAISDPEKFQNRDMLTSPLNCCASY